jgi:hypothetical protein
MVAKARKRKNSDIAFAFGLISLVIIALFLMSGFSKANIGFDFETIINQSLRQTPNSLSPIGINETNSLNETNLNYNYSSAPINADSVSINTSGSTVFEHLDTSGFFFLPPSNTFHGQMVGTTLNNKSYAPLTAAPISLDAPEFVTYTYGGCPVEQPDSTEFVFSFPDCCSQNHVAGSDALAWNFYPIQKMDFDVTFISPKLGALGFDEMAVFASSNTSTYKGTEFGVRMDLKDGFIYGYVQEPNGNIGDVNFRMLELLPNDGIMHHYTLFMLGSGVIFLIDGVDYGYMNFASNADYSSLGFSICVVVHRFTDGWDSSGDNMLAGNFSLNQQ